MRKDINRGQNLINQLRGSLGMGICLLGFFAGMGLSYIILLINDNNTKANLLIIHASAHLIFMILTVIFTFKDEKRLKKQGRCVWQFAIPTFELAFVLDVQFLFINVGAILDFKGLLWKHVAMFSGKNAFPI